MSIKKLNNDRRVRRTKQSLKDALLSLIQERELKDIAITDIVNRADLNRGTFYKHYHYKEDLLEEMIEDVLQDLIKSYREPYYDVDTLIIGELSSSAIKIFEHIAKYSTFYKVIFKLNMVPGFQNRIFHELKKLAMYDLTYYDSNPKVNREIHASYHTYAVLGMVIEWVNEDFKYSPQYMAEQLIEIINERPSKVVLKTTGHRV